MATCNNWEGEVVWEGSPLAEVIKHLDPSLSCEIVKPIDTTNHLKPSQKTNVKEVGFFDKYEQLILASAPFLEHIHGQETQNLTLKQNKENNITIDFPYAWFILPTVLLPFLVQGFSYEALLAGVILLVLVLT